MNEASSLRASNHHTQTPISKSRSLARLRIAIISDAGPSRNGVGTYYVDLQEHLQNRIERVELFSPMVVNDKWEAGLVFPLPGDKTQKLCMPNPFSLRRALIELDPHIVIIATPGVYGLVGAFLARRMGVPRVAGFHTSFEQITELYWKPGSAASRIVGSYFKVSNDYLFKQCPVVLANSEAMCTQALRLGAKQSRLISTTVSSVFTDHPVVPSTGRIEHILFAGRLAPEKNIDAVLDAARRHPELQFTLAGDGPLRETVQAKLDQGLSNVKLVGWLERESLRDEIDNHDLLVLPSHFEAFGTIALEAMARQRQVIVSSGCGIADWPEFAEGLNVMGHQSLSESLGDIQASSVTQNIEQAQRAQKLSLEFNERSLQDWFTVLLEHANL